MTNILAIETSSSACSLALMKDEAFFHIHRVLPMKQTDYILPLINELMESHTLSLSDLNAIAFGCGPGSFTGIRIAACVAQALGYALAVPLISISSLAALAQTAYLTYQWKTLWVAVQARIGQVYNATYIVNEKGWVELENTEQLNLIAEMKFKGSGYGVGNGWIDNQSQQDPISVDTTLIPLALAVAHLAKVKYHQKAWTDPFNALPVYF